MMITDFKLNIFRNVLRAARQYPSVYNIQMAVTACLYNLCHGDLAVKLHPHILRDVVNTDLDAMETFHQHQQLQKNILLTICCDRIINDVNFDRFRCAKLALKCLGEWQDNSMNKMSVAICSMLGNCTNIFLNLRLVVVMPRLLIFFHSNVLKFDGKKVGGL